MRLVVTALGTFLIFAILASITRLVMLITGLGKLVPMVVGSVAALGLAGLSLWAAHRLASPTLRR
jgi:hypothetical protein